MKKLGSVILVLILLLYITVMPSFAETTENNYLFKDKFIEYYVEGKGVSCEYEEVYYHYSESEEVDWCLVFGTATNISRESYEYLKFSDFVLTTPNIRRPFDLQYAVYDVKKEVFVDLVDGYDELEQYEGLIDVLRELDRSVMLGDGDEDGKLTVLDATRIQMHIAQIERLWDGYIDRRGVEFYFSDYDGDGELSILDATGIQLYLAKSE